MNKAVHLFISGKVQGVWYRDTACKEAKRLSLTGWVKNLPDGRVESYAEGDSTALDEFVSWCKKGPELSNVDEVFSEFLEAKGEFSDFTLQA